jgi:BolA protein
MSRYQRIHDILSKELHPNPLMIEDESNRHNVPEGAESHFKVTAVSSQFNDLKRLERHRLMNNLLQHELTTGLHALSLHLYTPEEWLDHSTKVPSSPACQHSKKD